MAQQQQPQQWTESAAGTAAQSGGATGYAEGAQGQGAATGQQPFQGTTTQPSTGQQSVGQQAQFSQQPMGQQAAGGEMGLTLDDVLTSEMRMSLADFEEAAEVCEWCADQCIGDEMPGMSECIRLCRDVADLATLNAKFLARDSIFGPDAAETFAVAAEACAQECARHPHAHCQECAHVLRQAVESTREMLASLGWQGATTGTGGGATGQQLAGGATGQPTGQQPMTQQSTGQQQTQYGQQPAGQQGQYGQ